MQITRTSMISGETRTLDLPVTQEQMDAFTSGRLLVQQAFPHLSDGDREFILTGITDEEWNATFADDEEDEGPDYTSEQRADAKADLDRYFKTLMEADGWRAGLAIEKKWGLDGLTPEMVTRALADIAEDAA